MAGRDILKNINCFVDGRGFAGQVTEFNPPKITLKVEDFRAGGMDASIPITMGMEKLEASFQLAAYDKDVLASIGFAEGSQIPLVLRGALESFDGKVTPVVHTMRGKITEIDPGSHKPGELASLTVTFAPTYYKLEHGSTVVHEIDVENMIRTINGVDALVEIRKALGI